MNIPHPPRFSGDNVISWTIDVQNYFDYIESPDTMRLFVVEILFEHPASEWFHDYRSSNPDCSWQEFLDAVIQKFHPTAILFNNIRQMLYNWRDESARKSARKSTQALKLPVELSTKSDEEPELSTKSELELPKELSTVSDLDLSAEISTLETLMVEPAVDVTEDEDMTDDEEQGDSDKGVAPDDGVTFSIVLVQHDPLSPPTPTRKMCLLLRRRYTRKRSRQWRCNLITFSPLCFSDFHLEDKVVFNRGGVDTDIFSTSSNFLHESRI